MIDYRLNGFAANDSDPQETLYEVVRNQLSPLKLLNG